MSGFLGLVFVVVVVVLTHTIVVHFCFFFCFLFLFLFFFQIDQCKTYRCAKQLCYLIILIITDNSTISLSMNLYAEAV